MADNTSHPRSQCDAVGLSLQHGLPKYPPSHHGRQQSWRHGYTQKPGLLPQLQGRLRPRHMPVETSFGHASKQLHTPWPALELPPCHRQGQVTVPTCPLPALTHRAAGLGRGGRLRGLLLRRLGRLCKRVESVPPWSWGEEGTLKEGSKQGGGRQEMEGQERGRGGCLQGDREEGVQCRAWGWGSGMCTEKGLNEPDDGIIADQDTPTALSHCPTPSKSFSQPQQGQVEGTGLQECFSNQHWPPDQVLRPSPGTKTGGSTCRTCTGMEETPRRN